MRALAAAGVALDDVDLLAVAAGPGSFTGLRVGIAAMQGLAIARGLKIVPVSALEALARQAQRSLPPARTIAAWVDAQRGEVFAALYAGSPLDELAPPTAASPEQTLDARTQGLDVSRAALLRRRRRRPLSRRDRAQRSATARTSRRPPPRSRPRPAESPPSIPSAPSRPHAVVPIYVRRPDAELARDRARTR